MTTLIIVSGAFSSIVCTKHSTLLTAIKRGRPWSLQMDRWFLAGCGRWGPDYLGWPFITEQCSLPKPQAAPKPWNFQHGAAKDLSSGPAPLLTSTGSCTHVVHTHILTHLYMHIQQINTKKETEPKWEVLGRKAKLCICTSDDQEFTL